MGRLTEPLLRLVAIASLVMGTGCHAGNAPSAAHDAVASAASKTEALPTVEETIARIGRVRHHAPARPVRVEWLSDADLRARFAELARAGRARNGDGERTPLGAIVEPERQVDIDRAHGATLEAFYAIERDVVVMPRTTSGAERIKTLATLGHELEHAIIAQRFGPARAREGATRDEQLALLALHEGDATATMGAVVADDAGIPEHRALRQIAELVSGLGPEQLGSPEHRSQAQVEHAALLYGEGMSFVVDLYRVGGFDLVDQAFRTPPVSTAQILEPQRYLDGELPVPVAALAPPSGMRVAESGVLGAHRLGSMLQRCGLGEIGVVRGWDGDRLSLVVPATTGTADPRRHALALVTTWRSEFDAQRFEARARKLLACLSPGHEVTAERRGLRVVAVAAPRDAAALIEAGTRSVGERPPAVPIAPLRIPPRAPLPVGGRGTVDHDVYRSEWLGLAMPLPEAVAWSTAAPEIELKLEADGLFAGLTLSNRYVSAAQDERTLREMKTAMEETADVRLRQVADEWEVTKLGRSRRVRFVVDDTTMRVVVEMLPICRGTGSLVYLVFAADDARERRMLAAWRTAAFTTPTPPVCARLDPR